MEETLDSIEIDCGIKFEKKTLKTLAPGVVGSMSVYNMQNQRFSTAKKR